jgi:hypothetical protein
MGCVVTVLVHTLVPGNIQDGQADAPAISWLPFYGRMKWKS